MTFRFWGVRRSIPSPGPRTVRYGGNTTCIEVRTGGGTLIVLDAGTGLYPLAQDLMARRALGGGDIDANIFITHSHWDHIHGLPFFTPLFVKGSRVCLHGAHDPVRGKGIEHVMGVQLQNSYFPVGEECMDATIDYRTLRIGEPHQLGDARIDNVLMNHPVTNLGYRISCAGKSLFFTGDHEPFHNPHPAGHPEHEALAREIARRQHEIDAAMAGVDALIADCTNTVQEYPTRQGWGHGTFDAALEMALRAGAKALYCTHHEPARGDDELEAVFADALARFEGRLGDLRVALAYEGMQVAL
ncbi:MBL fold metallo-hydrolase [Massilia sp. LXY-6]|uniref:MBL fold metallo-hydrolase n=1 Tax=Massilia sp. LXY-6 TaxID=3379823 RepID=UPI003EE3ED0D